MTTDQTIVVFLDIDGVLQPDSSQQRFRIDRPALKDRLAREVYPGFAALDEYDIAAVQVDWDPDSVANLKTICNETGAKIVISSSWRQGKTLDMLKLLFRIHDLDHFIIDMTPRLGPRVQEIEAWLAENPQVQRFLILDDQDASQFRARFPDAFVQVMGYLTDDLTQKSLAILSGK